MKTFTSRMQKLAIAGLLAAASVCNSFALTLTAESGSYVGLVNDGIPPSGAYTYITTLIGMTPGTSATIGTETYTRSNNFSISDLPEIPVGTTPQVIESNLGNEYTVFSSSYITGKYDQDQAGMLVWYVTAGSYSVQSTLNGHDISNIRIFGAPSGEVPGVPEGGSIIALMGIAFGALGLARRLALV